MTRFPRMPKIPGTALFLSQSRCGRPRLEPKFLAFVFRKVLHYQYDPTTAPYAYSMVAGFAQHLDAGSQVISLSHTQILRSNLSITETFGFRIPRKIPVQHARRTFLAGPIRHCLRISHWPVRCSLLDQYSGSLLFPRYEHCAWLRESTATSYSVTLLPIGAGADSHERR